MATPVERRLYINGRWTGAGEPIAVRNKYTGELIGTIPAATRGEVDEAIAAAAAAAPTMAELPAHRRAAIIGATAEIIARRREEFARTIAAEAGKALKFARLEVERGLTTFTFAAEEAKRLHGETVPLDAAAAGEGYFGFYVRRPVGVVVAIAPFNFPLNLVAHKVAPALAAGNAVVLKPASFTPLTAVLLVEALIEAGLPPGAINLVAGPGRTVGEWLVADERVAKVTF
ncbi:MAG TPA: aldehyde dehydrogenase family protein, partial [bacterium]|nr:aldehyde dehydrogenase family protein [bacterium]